jgi:tetratricopeptide (TPR) repeat protein
VAESLVEMWQKQDLKFADRAAIANFLLNSGRRHTLLNLLIETLNGDKEIPWAQLVEACRDLTFTPAAVNAILKGAQTQGLTEQLLLSHRLDAELDSIPQMRADSVSRRQSEYDQRRQALLDKLEYFRSQRMFDEEGRVLREFNILFPGDLDYSRIARSYEERWAREIIQQKGHQTVPESLPPDTPKTEHEQELEKTVSEAVMAGAEEHPNLAYDLAILLYFLELYPSAQLALKWAPNSIATDWFGLELLIRGRQFVEALEEVNRLEKKYASNPESTFSAAYGRARALHGLGQTEGALELLRSIVNLRPHYRSAQILINDWSGARS